jgi:glycosyltransferase involved in cell wall biosynthesis
VTVYCRKGVVDGEVYRGMRRVVLPAVSRKALETLTHTAASTAHVLARTRPDAAIVFNAANAPYVGLLRFAGVPVCLHIDGHDARRAKWRGIGAHYYRFATRWGSKVAHETVVDSYAVQYELYQAFGLRSRYIAYGAKPANRVAPADPSLCRVLGVEPDRFHLVVARFEPENQVLEIIRGYASSAAELPLLVVGFEGYPGDYSRAIAEAASTDPRVQLVGPIWDQELLDALYAGARTYVHGHSVGGTNPSLLRAMAQSTAVIAYDCPYNRETTGGHAWCFRMADDLVDLFKVAETDGEVAAVIGERLGQRAQEHYRWSEVTDAYEELLVGLADRRHRRRSARRTDQDRHRADG